MIDPFVLGLVRKAEESWEEQDIITALEVLRNEARTKEPSQLEELFYLAETELKLEKNLELRRGDNARTAG